MVSINLVEEFFPGGPRPGIYFVSQVECHCCRGGDSVITEIQTRPDIVGDNPKLDIAVDLCWR
jgi:hypothetical protein